VLARAEAARWPDLPRALRVRDSAPTLPHRARLESPLGRRTDAPVARRRGKRSRRIHDPSPERSTSSHRARTLSRACARAPSARRAAGPSTREQTSACHCARRRDRVRVPVPPPHAPSSGARADREAPETVGSDRARACSPVARTLASQWTIPGCRGCLQSLLSPLIRSDSSGPCHNLDTPRPNRHREKRLYLG
jgi:hypothetical protein